MSTAIEHDAAVAVGQAPACHESPVNRDRQAGACSTTVSLEDRHAGMARLAAIAILALMAIPLFTGQVYFADDLVNYHYPLRKFYSECLKNGDAFDWHPGLFSGFYLTGSGQAGTYHPWHWLLYRALPLEAAFNLEILSSYPFMLAGMVLFLKRRLERRDAAWLGGITFTFSGFCLMHFLHPNAIAVVAHIPWLLLAIDCILNPLSSDTKRSRVLAEVGIPLLTASQLLCGYPQYVWFSLLAEMVYCLGFSGWTLRGWGKLLWIAVLKLLGLVIGAVQILPSLDALSQSSRTGLTPDYFYEDPFTPADLLQFVGPYMTTTRVFGDYAHELAMYCGAMPLLLVIYGLSGKNSVLKTSPLARVMLVLGVLALWLGLGKLGGLYVLQTYLPMVGKFRWPARIIVLLHFAFAVLAAEGYRQLAMAVERDEAKLPWWLKYISLVSAAAAQGTWLLYDPERVSAPISLALGPVLLFIAWRMLGEFAGGAACVGLMLFVAGDLAAYGLNYAVLGQSMSPAQIIAEIDAPPGDPSQGKAVGEIQIFDGHGTYQGNELLLAGWKQADGYEGLVPRMHLLRDEMTVDTLRVAGVKWVINAGAHARVLGLPVVGEKQGWLEVPDPLPRARLTSNFVVVDRPEAAVARIDADGPVVVGESLELPQSSTARGTATITTDRPGNITVNTAASSEQLLVLAERFIPGWQATLDGQPVRLVSAEVDFMACVVPAGDHVIEFVFAPKSLAQGRTISLAALLVLVALGLTRWCVLPSQETSAAAT